jgi:YYY domain-containing protein
MAEYIALLLWYFWMQIFSFAGLMVAQPWLKSLPDRGYGISKALGMLLAGYVYWISISIGVARNDSGAAILALIVLAVLGAILHYLHEKKDANALLKGFLQSLPSRKIIITTEIIFSAAYLLLAGYRAYNPNIETAGGEKFMEAMMLNAILRSPSFPPNDAWLSGFSISYYYFGYVMQAMLTRISGVPSGIAFNLAGAMTFALTAVSAFSVGYNLWQSQHTPKPDDPETQSRPVIKINTGFMAGLLTAFMITLMGNLGAFIEAARCTGVVSQPTVAWLDIKNFNKDTPLECNGIRPTRFYWWWTWSRVVHDITPSGADQEAITEFPAFSFVLGDNHPHVMNLPFVLLALTLALWSWRQFSPPARQPAFYVKTVVLAIIIGGLSFMNTWDLPVFGGLIIGLALLRMWYSKQPLMPTLMWGGVVLILSYVLYLPFYSTFASQARGIGVNLFNGTRFPQFFIMFAPFVLLMPAYLWLQLKQSGLANKNFGVQMVLWGGAAVVACVLGAALLGLISPTLRGLLDELNRNGSAMGVSQATVLSRAIARLADPWVPLYLISSVVAVILCLYIMRQKSASARLQSLASVNGAAWVYIMILFAAGALLAASVEFVFLLDNFGTRMNSIFKFYYQTWVLWSVGGAFALMTLAQNRAVVYKALAGVTAILAATGVLYPIFTAYSRTDDFKRTPTLDGAAYLRQTNQDDAKVIDWLNINVKTTAVIAEAPGDKGKSYAYEGRIATFTGLPTLLGWAGHQSQWRGNYTEPGKREPIIETLFNSTDLGEAKRIIRNYNVQYVVLGNTELKRYSPEGLAKFSQLGREVFRSGEAVVYKMQ